MTIRTQRRIRAALAAVAASLLTASAALAQNPAAATAPVAEPAKPAAPPPPPTAAQTDPKANAIMQGSPPPPDKIVRFNDGSSSRFPGTRWGFNHIRELVPTANVSRGAGHNVARMVRTERDLDKISFKTWDGKTLTFADVPALTYADGLLVLHRGRIVYEKYFGEGAAARPHIAFSATKSIVGTLAEMLVAQGKLDPKALVAKYIPELKDSAYSDATVRDVMDMTIGVKYSEAYTDPKAEVFDYARAGGMIPVGPNYTGPKSFTEFLVKLQKEGSHGDAFAYKTPNAEVLAWIIARVSGQTMAELLSSAIWSKLGAESDAYFMIDSVGMASGGGGLNATLRDLARFGEMMRNKGRFNGQQIIPAAAVAEIEKGGDKEKFVKAGYTPLKNWSYRDMWWITHNEHKAYIARGIYGQAIYIDPKAEMVIVRSASHPVAANAANDPITLPAFMAVAKELMK